MILNNCHIKLYIQKYDIMLIKNIVEHPIVFGMF